MTFGCCCCTEIRNSYTKPQNNLFTLLFAFSLSLSLYLCLCLWFCLCHSLWHAEHQEQFYLYLIISVTAGVLLCLTLVIGRLTLQRRGSRLKRSSSVSGVAKNFAETPIDGTGGGGAAGGGGGSNFQQMATGETHLGDTFGDDISDIDVDVDLTAPMPLSSLSSRNEVSCNTNCLTKHGMAMIFENPHADWDLGINSVRWGFQLGLSLVGCSTV